MAKIVSDSHRQMTQVVNYVFLCGLVSLFGTVTNVINLVVFYKQGLNSSINISFFAMAISDLCSLVMQQWFNICVNPLFENSDVPMVPSEFQYVTAGVPRAVFAEITCLITVYATAERCLCIVFPLHIKQMITPRRTATAMFFIYVATVSSVVPIYCTTYIGWKYYSGRNKTLLGLVFATDSYRFEQVSYVIHAILSLLAFIAVVAFTTILIRKLRQKKSWRTLANLDVGRSQSLSNRDRKTMSLVVVIACILIVCYTPSVVIKIATFLEPEFSIAGQYTNMFFLMWSFAFLLEAVNSSVNIFLYMNMSTKYRETFLQILTKCTRETRKLK